VEVSLVAGIGGKMLCSLTAKQQILWEKDIQWLNGWVQPGIRTHIAWSGKLN